MGKLFIQLLGTLLFLQGCSTGIILTKKTTKSYQPLNNREIVNTFMLSDPTPDSTEELGIIAIQDHSFSNCVDSLKFEARKIGGNAIKIYKHLLPYMDRNTDHQVSAKILRITISDSIVQDRKITKKREKPNYAIFHFYHLGAPSVKDIYNSDIIMLRDSIVCYVGLWGEATVRINRIGNETFKAMTIPQNNLRVDIKPGEEYFVRWNVSNLLQLVSKGIGREESLAIKLHKKFYSDEIILNDGKTFQCIIIGENNNNICFYTLLDDENVYMQILKASIKEIKKKDL